MSHIDAQVISDLLRKSRTTRLKRIIDHADIASLAIVIDQLKDKDKIAFYLLISTKISSEVLLEVSQHSRKFILKSLKDKYIISAIEKSQSDDSADILGEVDHHKAKRILASLTKEKKEAIEPLIKHQDFTAGGLMQSELISLPSTLSVKDAMSELKSQLKKMEGINYVYAVDSKERIKGVISLQDIFTASKTKKLHQLMNRNVIKVAADMHEEKVAEIFRKEDIISLPVVDKQGRILGRVTVDDVLDVMEEEATEDMFKIAGVHPDEHVFDPFQKSLKRRFPWLVLNLITAILAAITISLFSATIEAVVILAAFMPIIAGMGGNAATQTLTLIVRGLALNHLNLTNYKKTLVKESLLGTVNGILIGIIMAVIAYFWTNNVMMGVVILVSMIITMLVAGFIGAAIPILLRVVKIDPAVSSSVFITTFTDVVGFFSFLGIATLLIHLLV